MFYLVVVDIIYQVFNYLIKCIFTGEIFAQPVDDDESEDEATSNRTSLATLLSKALAKLCVKDDELEHRNPDRLQETVELFPTFLARKDESENEFRERVGLVLQTLHLGESISKSGKTEMSLGVDVNPANFIADTVAHHADRSAFAKSNYVRKESHRRLLESKKNATITTL
jgi:hypothetical protein